MSQTIQLRGDLSSNWTSVNPVLNQREVGLETDTGKAKLGDGVTAWTSLAYWKPAGDASDVLSVFGRAGAVVATPGDYSVGQVTGAAPLASPALTGSPTAPTQAGSDSSTKLATTAFVAGSVATETTRAETAESANATAITAETSRARTAEGLLAPLASPSLIGNPTAPTQTTGDSSTKLATDAFVTTAVATETTRAEAAEALLAPLASPALTGSPTAPTKSALTNNTDIATTAYADSAVGVEKTRALAAEAAAQTAAEAASTPILTRVLFTVPSPGSIHTALANEITAVDTTSGSGIVKLPNAPAAGSVNAVKQTTLGTGNTVTLQCQGSDVINKTGGGTSGTETLLAQGMLLHYSGSGIWTVLSDDLPLSQLDSRYLSVPALTGGVTVSPIGLTTSGVTIANNGAMFGPDTSGTTTQGLQEAATYAIAQVANITGLIAPPSLLLMPGIFTSASTITIPAPTGTSTNSVGFEIAGAGHLATQVKFSAGQGFLFGQYGWQDVVFRDLSIQMVNGGTATSLIAVVGTGSSFPTLRSEMMFEHVWFELPANPASLPSNGCIYWGPSGGQTGGWDLYFTNSVLAGSFSITSPYDASFLNCLVASGANVTFTTTTPITHINSSEITGQVVLSGTNLNLRVDNSYWNQIPTTGAVSCSANSGTTNVTVQKSSLNFLGSGAIVSQSASVIELHCHYSNIYVNGGTYTLLAGGCSLSHTSTYGGNYHDGFYAGPGASVQAVTLTANPPVSGTVYQNTLGIAIWVHVPVTYSPTPSAAATCALAVGPQSSPATISTETCPANGITGIIATMRFRVPAGWYYELTATNATIGTAAVLPEQ